MTASTDDVIDNWTNQRTDLNAHHLKYWQN